MKPQGVYDFSSLGRYTFRERLLIRLIGLAAFACISLWSSTIRWKIEGWENFERARAAGTGYILALWHNRIFLGTWFWRGRGIVAMTSRSFDGEYIARFLQRFGYGAARGSSSRGAGSAFLIMTRCMRSGMDTAFTIDGPRGPRYVAKPGATMLARKTGGMILPFHVSSDRYWEAGSWDRFQVPRPFSRAAVLIGEPFGVPPSASDEDMEAFQRRLQDALDGLRERGDRLWSRVR